MTGAHLPFYLAATLLLPGSLASAAPSGSGGRSNSGQTKTPGTTNTKSTNTNNTPQRDPHPQSTVRKKPALARKIEPEPSWGLGLTLGYEAPFGNAVTVHVLPARWLDLFAGAGYNLTGPKFGLGGEFDLYIGDSGGVAFASSYAYSAGTSGTISLEANFTPDGSSTPEPLTAAKEYELSAAHIVNVSAGGFWRMNRSLKWIAMLSYNAVVGGNEATLGDEIKYSEKIDATNDAQFDEKFNAKAKEEAIGGGVGFAIGARLLF